MQIPPDLLALAAAQEGLVSRLQCLQAEMTRTQIETVLKNGKWQRVHRGVYAVFTGPLGDDARLLAAVLAVDAAMCGAAAASGESALWTYLRRGPLGAPVHLNVEAGRHLKPVAGIRVHEVVGLRSVGRCPPRSAPEAALLEAVHRATTRDRVVSLICSMVGSRRTSPGMILGEMSRRPRQRWRGFLQLILAEVAHGAQSPLELLDLRNDRAHGLPLGQRQVYVKLGGQGRRIDVLVTLDDEQVVKELDGRLGHEGMGKFRDMSRDNSTAFAGATALRFGWADLHGRRCEVAAGQELLWRRRTGRSRIGHPCPDRDCNLEARLARLAAAHPLLRA